MSIQHMQTVFDAGELTAPQKAVLLAYCNFTDAHGYCWPGVERIADMTGLSVSGVKKVRKQLIEAKLLTTVSRGKKGGGRKTNGSRINVKRLQKMKLPPREYDDNIAAELGFEEDNEPEETPEPAGAKVPEGHPNGSPGAPQRYLGGTNEGTCGDPYPSVDPSGDPSSSSAEVEDITTDIVPEASTKKTKIIKKSPEDIVLERLAHMNPTLEEAPAVVALVIHKAAVNGTRVEQPDRWIRGRDERVLEQDLEDVRRRSSKPGADVCGLHSVSLESGSCSSCMGDIKAGDADTIRAHLLEVGGDSRPDLVAVLGTPQVSAHTSGGGWSWENQLRGERRARIGHTP